MSAPLELPVDAVIARFEQAIPRLAAGPVRAPLVRARLADAIRLGFLPPPLPSELDVACAALDDQGWRRLALFVDALEERAVHEAFLRAATVEEALDAWVRDAFLQLAGQRPLHTLELLSRSEHRREELARTWLLRMGVAIAGETVEESLERLDRLDYARVLSDLEQAKAGAEERAAYVRKLQEKADELLRPRGKL